MNHPPLYIFDLDGTLALIQHRRHFVENRANRWDEFHAACVDDSPNYPVISIYNALHDANAEIRVWSGRSDIVRAETETWLNRFVRSPRVWGHHLMMRPHGNYTPDDVLKRSWYDALDPADKHRLVCTFDDRDRMVAMWRSIGVTCLQVAPGDF